jgi:hypothetical protein
VEIKPVAAETLRTRQLFVSAKPIKSQETAVGLSHQSS